MPDSNCSRGEFITFLWKYAGSPKVNIEQNFSDIQTGTEYEKAVNWAISIGITNGNGSGKFLPDEDLVRKDIVTFLYRYANGANNFGITYNLNGGKISKDNQTSYKAGTSEITLNNPTKKGYTFVGWTGSNIVEIGNIEKNNYKPQKNVMITKNDTGNKIYTANWVANNYIVSFNANGGEGTVENEYFKYDDVPQKLLKNEFIRKGYNFKGWNTNKEGTGKTYIDEQVVRNLTEVNEKTITLYAQWEEKEQILKIGTDLYKIENTQILNVKENTTISAFKSGFNTNATEIKIYNSEGNKEQLDNELISTGMKVEFKYREEIKIFTVSVIGDVNGDGRANSSDMIVLNRHRLKRIKLEGVYFSSGDLNEDGTIDVKDIVKINRFRLNKN